MTAQLAPTVLNRIRDAVLEWPDVVLMAAYPGVLELTFTGGAKLIIELREVDDA